MKAVSNKLLPSYWSNIDGYIELYDYITGDSGLTGLPGPKGDRGDGGKFLFKINKERNYIYLLCY